MLKKYEEALTNATVTKDKSDNNSDYTVDLNPAFNLAIGVKGKDKKEALENAKLWLEETLENTPYIIEDGSDKS